MNLKNIHSIFFIGIGGIGMSALARYFKSKGLGVSGYDKNQSLQTDLLLNENIAVYFRDDPAIIPENSDLIIYTPAVPDTLQLFQAARSKNIPCLKRAEVLGIISDEMRTLAVSGTHGKTSVSTMIMWIMYNSMAGCNAILGGLSRNFNSNFVADSQSEFLVTEADEFDNSFLKLHPEIAVITSTDADHLDIYGDKQKMLSAYEKFTGNIKDHGTLVIKNGIKINTLNHAVYTYSVDKESDFYAQNIKLIDGLYHFDFIHPNGHIEDITLGIPGLFNVENAIGALAASWIAGIEKEALQKSLATFSGIKRRFEVHIQNADLVYIDDYAHHPAELDQLIKSVRNLYPGKNVMGIFQPHLFSRTKEFSQEFAESLDHLDQCILLPVYPAREEPIEGVSSKIIYREMQLKNKHLLQKENLLEFLQNAQFDILLSIGAGNIDQLVDPIKNSLTKTLNK